VNRQAVLFDVGGPIDLETRFERDMDSALRAIAAELSGAPVSEAAYAEAARAAVASFAPNAYRAILHCLLGPRAAEGWALLPARLPPPGELEIRPGIPALLGRLAGRGIKLALAANQPAAMVGRLADAGIAELFDVTDVSGTIGLRKPDPRLFLHACSRLGVAPEACIMVGDRIDNDIAPARALGMAAIRVRTGRHAGQMPRDWSEIPDADVTDTPALAQALDRLLGEDG
jgi:putative hydrolase of the HAD superfamily